MNLLTDEEIEACATDDGSDDMAFARAIEAAVLAKVDAIDTSKERVEKYSANRQVGVEPVATLWREKNQKLYPGPLWKLTPSGVELPLGIEHQLVPASALAALQAENESLSQSLHKWIAANAPGGWIDTLRTQLAQAQAERDAAVADAERYRWLKEHRRTETDHGDLGILFACGFEHYDSIDAAIDAARAALQGG